MKKEKIYVPKGTAAVAVTDVETTETQNIETETVNENGTPETETVTEQTPETETPTPTAQAEHKPDPTPTAQAEQVQAATTQTAPQPQRAETIEELQKRLDVELARLNYKRQLANNRQKFINSMGSLQIYIDDLKNEKEFETKSGKITFKVLEADRYDRTDFVDSFSITDTALIHKFCEMLYSEMKQKKTELETQLLTA